jgi:predicted Rossmann-fold nucleotide-binding protein
VQTRKVTRFPVILFGTDYWSGLIAWIRDTLIPAGKVNPADLELLTCTDDVDQTVKLIVEAGTYAGGGPLRPEYDGE